MNGCQAIAHRTRLTGQLFLARRVGSSFASRAFLHRPARKKSRRFDWLFVSSAEQGDFSGAWVANSKKTWILADIPMNETLQKKLIVCVDKW